MSARALGLKEGLWQKVNKSSVPVGRAGSVFRTARTRYIWRDPPKAWSHKGQKTTDYRNSGNSKES